MGSRCFTKNTERARMEDSVSYKAFLAMGPEKIDTEVRRFVVEKNVSTSFTYLKEKLASMFPSLGPRADFVVSWTDSDGDMVTIATDEELMIALTEMPGPLYRLHLKSTGQKSYTQERSGDTPPPGHHAPPPPHGHYAPPPPPHHGWGPFAGGRGMFRGRGRGFGMGMGPGCSFSGPNGSWSFSSSGPWDAMMKGWMGTGCGPETSPGQEKGSQKEHEKAHSEAYNAAKDAHEQAHAAASAAHEAAAAAAQEASAAATAAGFTAPGTSAEYLQNVGSFVAAALDPFGIDVQVHVETPKSESEMNDKKGDEDIKSFSSSSDEEEWTVVSDKKKNGKEEEKNIEIPIEKETQEKPKENIYPDLPKETSQVDNESTNVASESTMDVDPKSPPPLTSGSAEAAKAPEPEKTKEAPVASHPDPKIQVALQAMMNMGFSNEGGWLANLLEAKSGDIGKVLDILQPVKK